MKTIRNIYNVFYVTVSVLLIGVLFSCSSANKKRPNIVFILADDLGYSDIGCYGGEISTPNLDRLAEEGIRFTQIHNTSKCFPSRACLLTGLYAQQCGYDKTPTRPLKNAVTLGEVLRAAGYRTLFSGKHHGVDNPYDRGFDRYFGLRDGCCNYFNPGRQRAGESKPAQKRSDRVWCIDDKVYKPYTPPERDFYTTDYFTKYALDWLEEYKEEDKPFFLYLAYTAPHDPLQAWPKDINKYRGKYMVGYEAIRKKRFEKQKEIGLLGDNYVLSEPTYHSWDSLSDKEKIKEDLKMAVYAAMIDRMDQNIGKILRKIRNLNKLENTLIIFASDNGCSAESVHIPGSGEIGSMTRWTSLGRNWANVSNTPLRYYKNYSYEGGICTPMIVYWPSGVKGKNRISNFRGHFIDIMATLIDITKAEYPEEFNGEKIIPYQGVSLLPIFEGKKMKRKKPLFYEWWRGRAVMSGKWKIVADGNNKPWDLYNINKDPSETKNLSAQFPEIVKKLDKAFREWQRKCNSELNR